MQGSFAARKPQRARLPAIALLLGGWWLIGCAMIPQQVPQAGSAVSPIPVTPIAVAHRDIVSVLTVDAVVLAYPEFVIVTPAEGTLRHIAGDGSSIMSGQSIASVGELHVSTPVSATLVEWLIPDEVVTPSELPIVKLAFAGFGVIADVPVDQAFRLYDGATGARIQLRGGPGILECEPVQPAEANTSIGSLTVPVMCLLESTGGILAGQSGTLALDTGAAANALAVPINAVAGDAESGQVARVVSGEIEIVNVTLGLSDGLYVEIRSGLNEGDEILPYGPNLVQLIQ